MSVRLDTLEDVRGDALVSEGGGRITRWLQRWLSGLVEAARVSAVPLYGIIGVYLTGAQIAQWFDADGLALRASPYWGFQIANGNNGSQNANGRFIRYNTAGAGATGGNDSSAHTHDIDHNHASFTSGAGSAHSHGSGEAAVNGTLRAMINLNTVDDTIVADIDGTVASWDADRQQPTAGAITDPGVYAQTQAVNVMGETDTESAHTHAVDVPALGTAQSGAASATENRPAYLELVPLQRIR